MVSSGDGLGEGFGSFRKVPSVIGDGGRSQGCRRTWGGLVRFLGVTWGGFGWYLEWAWLGEGLGGSWEGRKEMVE